MEQRGAMSENYSLVTNIFEDSISIKHSRLRRNYLSLLALEVCIRHSVPANLCAGDADEPVAELALESREDVAQFRYHAPVHDRIL